MITTTISCDICGAVEIPSRGWESRFAAVTFTVEHPSQELRRFDHVCYECRAALSGAFKIAVNKLGEKCAPSGP